MFQDPFFASCLMLLFLYKLKLRVGLIVILFTTSCGFISKPNS